MLGKLMKYELRATSRTMLPLLLLTLLLSVFTRMTSAVVQSGHSKFITVINTLLILAFFLALIGTAVFSVVLMVMRFRNNLMTDEGYLMFTLPVKHWQLITSKLLTALLLVLCSIVVGVASAALLAGNKFPWKEIFAWLREIDWSFKSVLLLVLLILLLVFSVAKTVLHFYISMAIGQLSNKRKVLCSVGAFFGISLILTTTVTTLFNSLLVAPAEDSWIYTLFRSMSDTPLDAALLSVGLYLGATLLQCAIFFFPTELLLRRKLNLE